MYRHTGAAQWQAVSAGPALRHGHRVGAEDAALILKEQKRGNQAPSTSRWDDLQIGLCLSRSRVNFKIWDLHTCAHLPVVSRMSFDVCKETSPIPGQYSSVCPVGRELEVVMHPVGAVGRREL